MEGATNYIVFAIPIFFLLIGVELLAQKMAKSELYRFNDAVTNISCGVTQQVFGALVKTAFIIGYLFLYEEFRLFENIPNSWWVWVLCFLGVDLFYYWFHRYSHEVSFFWGAHIVHHQSEEYNLSVALRQGAFQPFFSSIFYLPLALIGFNPVMFVVVNQLQTLYQFWIHTRVIGKMPRWVEFIFNTPSHHRVHHGRNPKYIDRNHGGTLIIWDRLFGTFQEEEEEVVYGVTKPLNSWNPIWANFDYYSDLFRGMGQVKGLGNKLKMLVMKPGWLPDDMGGPIGVPEIRAEEVKKYETRVTIGLNFYVLFQYVLLIGGTSAFLFLGGKFPLWLKLSAAGLIFISVATLGGLFELRRWALPTEIIRLLLIAAAIPVAILNTDYVLPAAIAMSGLTLLSLVWLLRYLPAFRQKTVVPS